MTARAVSPRLRGKASGKRLFRGGVCGALAAFVLTDPAAAQIAPTVGLDSDFRYRGYSLSDGHPTASAQVSYDDPSGFYASASGLTDLGDGVRFLGGIANAGYAKRLNEHVTLDGGVLRSQVRSAYPGGLDFKYTEIYAGAYVGPVVGRIYYSPDYRTSGQSTLYGEIDHNVKINYYRPRGDNKEGWDNIDIVGWMGYPMQIKVNFLCRDSILAAPIVLDLALFMDLAARAGQSGVQEWLSFYFKSPQAATPVPAEHDLFIQQTKLKNTLREWMGEEPVTHSEAG